MSHEATKAAVLSVGDELVLGQSLDTNSRWLSERLLAMGIRVVEHATVPDDAAVIAGAMTRLAGAADCVIVTGGLGPTKDDLTREALSLAAGSPLVEDAAALALVRAWFDRAGRAMPEPNRAQARRPSSAAIMENTAGTAPGLRARVGGAGGADVFCLPGPPREMRAMFERCVAPLLRGPAGRTVITRAIHTLGLGESEVAARLGELMDRGRMPLVGTTVSGGVVTCRVRYEGAEGAEGAGAVAETERLIRERVGAYVFGADGDTLPGVVLDLLKQRGETLAVVESCTGGLLGALITEAPGSSAAFLGGFVTYTNDAKQREVGVPASLFAPGGPGAVSRECALAMARGGLERLGADHCLAVTGIAGPDGGSDEKPVGTVWVARATKRPATAGGVRDAATEARRFLFAGDRQAVRDWAAKSALAILRLSLVGAGALRLLRERDS